MRVTARAAALVALVGAMLATVSPAQAEQARDPAFGQPTVGACYDMSYRELLQGSYGEAPVDCATKHTSQVIAVSYLPDRYSWGKISERALLKVAAKACGPALEQVQGGSEADRALTAYRYAFFYPTKAQRKAGARWLRCDIFRYGGTRKVAPLDASVAIGGRVSKSERSCLAGRPPEAYTICSRAHAWRATGAVVVSGKKFPGAKRLSAIGRERCTRKGRVQAGRYVWISPSKVRWLGGVRAITCYSSK